MPGITPQHTTAGITGLGCQNADRSGRTADSIRFPGDIEKNGDVREIPIVGRLRELIERRRAARQYRTELGTPALSPYVFHREGVVIDNPRKAWAKATAAAGVPGLLLHDLRRSTVKNLMDAGVQRKVAMRITGHRTEQVFNRYHIVTVDDVRQALERTQVATAVQPATNVVQLRQAKEA